MTISGYNITITRGDPYVTSFDVYARANGYPIEEGDGIFAGSITILPSSSTAVMAWSPPANATWKFLAVPIYRGISGPPGRIS